GVPAGSHAVLITKTSGIKDKTICPGEFSWYWERLLPTNTKTRKFVLKPCIYETELVNELPSGQVYAEMIEGNPDFSYEIDVTTEINMKPEGLPNFVRKTDAKTSDELNEYLEEVSEKIASDIVEYLLKESIRTGSADIFNSDLETLKKGIKAEKKYPDIEISQIEIESIVMPDIELYNIAKQNYQEFQKQVKQAIITISKNQSIYTADDYIKLERLSRWGKILSEYPILIDFIRATDADMSSVFEKEH
nr:hypothetical protein [Treponemataceae bacterium]